MFNNPRVRAVLGAGTALVVVAGIGIGVATSSSAASARFVTAAAATGDVTQTYTATGTITRKNTVEASFAVDGTVKKVDVAVGDEVEAGDTLATLNKAALQLAVLNAETSVARANASLYAAKHPSSTSSGSSGSGGSSGGSGSGSMGVTIDPMVLNEAAARVNLAVLDEADKCTAIFDAILPEAEPTATASPTATATATATGTATATSTATATAEPTDSGTVSTSAETATPAASATATPTPKAAAETSEAKPTASASQLASTLDADFTDEQLQACANARAEMFAANTNLQTVVTQLTSPTGGAGGKVSTAKKSSSSSSSTSVSASAVASAKADLLEAEQDLAAAKEDLADAELVAPISGTVGVVGLAKGDSASAGTITIVGSGSAVVTFELPLKTRELVKTGQSVTVTPAGSTKTLTGKITGISSLETSGTSGDTPTYTTTVSVSDADGLLASGAKASVLIPVKSASSVLRVPASAVTPTGTGTATVQVVESSSATTATTTQVETGAVGSGWVQITSGLDAGALVVLADNTAEIPSNTTNRRTTSTSSSRSSASASAAATAGATASAAPSAQPTSTASR